MGINICTGSITANRFDKMLKQHLEHAEKNQPLIFCGISKTYKHLKGVTICLNNNNQTVNQIDLLAKNGHSFFVLFKLLLPNLRHSKSYTVWSKKWIVDGPYLAEKFPVCCWIMIRSGSTKTGLVDKLNSVIKKMKYRNFEDGSQLRDRKFK